MKVISRTDKGYKQDPTHYLNFKRFSKQAGDFVLLEAGFGFSKDMRWGQYGFNKKQLNNILKKKIVRLDFEEPNKFCVGDDPNEYDDDFIKVYTICPYTAEWLNIRQKNKKHTPIYFPFNEQYIPKKTSKEHDIIYTGHILSKPILEDVKTISKFNYKVVSNSEHPLVTDKGVEYKEKLNLIAKSKITLVHNLLYLKPSNVFYIWKFPDWQENKAFKYIPKWYEPWRLFNYPIAPQLKSRLFEAAFSKSLILCKKDPFNIIERYFQADKEFVYFKEGELEQKIKEILENYKMYEKIIDSAFERAVKNYTTKQFFLKYLKGLV